MQVKRSDTLVLEPRDAGFCGFNYATGAEFVCDGWIATLIAGLQEWQDAEAVEQTILSSFMANEGDVLAQLLEAGVLVERGSAEALFEDEFRTQWRWGTPSAVLHQATTGRAICDLSDQVAMQQQKIVHEPSPQLGYVPEANAERVLCPDPDLSRGVFQYLATRRTVREGLAFSLNFAALSDFLFAGFGVTDWTDGSVGKLPLKLAPSGGARNPFDAFIWARSVDGLEPGPYRYSGLDHCIVPLGPPDETSIVALMGGQEWASNAACLIILVANFSRSMWKYEGDDNAYRVVMIEAGHIGQNIMLMATEHGLSACASAALDHDLAKATFSLDSVDQSAVYALAINKPAATVKEPKAAGH